ncbi:MAG: PRC-barrel domain-containing protein, partial [Methylovirgula sp.]
AGGGRTIIRIWGARGTWGSSPGIYAARRGYRRCRPKRRRSASPQHRNGHTGYHIHASDGEIGHVEDFLVADADWSIRYLVVDTKNWWLGKKVLISPRSTFLFSLRVPSRCAMLRQRQGSGRWDNCWDVHTAATIKAIKISIL